MNVIFLSPHFPYYYYNFCDRLKERGVNVLGIGDTPYDQISTETKMSVNEYYYVPDMNNYDDVYRAVAFYTSKYGKIDWIESENEYWLNLEAKLRTDYNITTGPKYKDMGPLRHKSQMKDVYKKAGIKVAPYVLIDSLETALDFAHTYGYPVIVKPDDGMGASDTHKISDDAEMSYFYNNRMGDITYIEETYIPGHVETFEGITDKDKNILISTSHVMVTEVMDNVNMKLDPVFYSQPVENKDIYKLGKKTVDGFNAKSRFFHFEFMRLDEDKEGLGKKGDLLGLEVNMRAPGAYIPDMMNVCYDVDVYTIWADMILYNHCYYDIKRKYYVAYAGRRTGKEYVYSTRQIYEKYGESIILETIVPEALAEAMGNHIFIVRCKTKKDMDQMIKDILLKP